ncbi:MAG: 3,4-dihydroxy-2-butanone-4-phosphate synthase [Flavobacteriaceae bacterium]|nr:3,4-dihydroxy-2-butanone-4-phosphate synthase [Flavobacteriaceae bacterium]
MNSEENLRLNKIPEAIEAIKDGKVVIVVDDEDRENEGDFVTSATSITPEVINFMAMHGRGLICTPLTEKRCKELDLHPMVVNNSDPMQTAFTVSVDLKGSGVTTGISAADRAKTIQALIDPNAKSTDFSKPGHIFPLIAKDGGVLRRTGHTEAAIDLARLAGHEPAGVIVEIMNEDGTMARLPQLVKIAKKFNLKIISIEDLVAYRMQNDTLVERVDSFDFSTKYGIYNLKAYRQTNNDALHIALTKGSWQKGEPVMVRVNSTVVHHDILGSLTSNFEDKIDAMFHKINQAEKGAILFIDQPKQGQISLKRLQQIKALQAQGQIKIPGIELDNKDIGIGAQILNDLDISKLIVLSNSQKTKRVGVIGYGLEILAYENY